MLIASRRHTARDLERWRIDEETDALNAQRFPLSRLADEATQAIADFTRGGRGYVGVSWGKDSVVVAHLSRALGWPLVYVRVRGVANPDCDLVRDAFLSRFAVEYHEVDSSDAHLSTGRLEAGFAVAAERFGDRYVSGVRGQESAARQMRMAIHGIATARTCAPIGRWSTAHVFAYLHAHDLPVHPAYACNGGGLWERDHLRVATIGGERGRGHGRVEWERRYYPEMRR